MLVTSSFVWSVILIIDSSPVSASFYSSQTQNTWLMLLLRLDIGTTKTSLFLSSVALFAKVASN